MIINYLGSEKGNPYFLFLGVAMVAIAIVLNAVAYRRKMSAANKVSEKGILLAVVGGILMSLFYRLIAQGMDLDNFHQPAAGKMTPYTAVVVFSTGIVVSNLLINSILIKRPFEGAPTSYKEYFA